MKRGVIHYGSNVQPICRPSSPFLYFAWSTQDKRKVSCKRCLHKLAKSSQS